jgi:squalene synthase HpnC
VTRDTTQVSDVAGEGSAAGSAGGGPVTPSAGMPAASVASDVTATPGVPSSAGPSSAGPSPAGPSPAGPSPAAAGSAVTESARAIGAQAAAQAEAENFPVALRLLPARYRAHLAAVYGFARSTDDMGDEAPPEQRLALLDELAADVARLYRSLGDEPGGERPRLPVVRALAPAVVACRIPAQPFLDLIEANRQDQAVSRYQTFEDLVGYCKLSANPVGRLVLHVFGAATPRREALSDQVCTALQLAEHWQDVAEDLRAGRIYLPGEDLASFGCGEADLAAPAAGPKVVALMTFETRRAREMLDAGAPIVGTLSGAARVAVAGYVAGGRAALAAIAGARYDVLSATRKPRKHRLVLELVRAYATGR